MGKLFGNIVPSRESGFQLVCSVVGEAAKRDSRDEIASICESAIKDGNLLLVDVSPESKSKFGELLREALNNGEIIKELLSWPAPDFDSSLLLPENQTPEVIAFICNAAAIDTLRRLTLFLDRFRS